jgi:phosphoglycolate phosphatase
VSFDPPADAALFDFDGVIIDSRRPVREALNGALVAHGFAEHPPAELDRFIGPPTTESFARLTGKPESSEIVATLTETYHRLYADVYLEQTTIVPGIEEVLNALALPLALATAKESQFVAPLLHKFGFDALFRAVSAATNPDPGAPHERKATIVERALRELGAQHAVMIGDRSHDVEAAHENGLRAIGVTWGIGDRAELAGAGADAIAERPSELSGILGIL